MFVCSVCVSDLSGAGAETVNCLGRGHGPEGREVAVLRNSTFQFLNAGHSLTEISSCRLSLTNYCLPSPPAAPRALSASR